MLHPSHSGARVQGNSRGKLRLRMRDCTVNHMFASQAQHSTGVVVVVVVVDIGNKPHIHE